MTYDINRQAGTAIAAGLMLFAAPARAEDLLPDRADVAGGRSQAAFEANGIRFGSYVLKPRLVTTGGYNNNLYSQETDRKEDGFASLAPAVAIASDWQRHQLTISAQANLLRYFRYTLQNLNEYTFNAAGRLDFDRLKIDGSISLSEAGERRGTNGVPLNVGAPSIVRSFTQTLQARRDTGPVSMRLGMVHRELQYNDLLSPSGAILSQAFRNVDQWNFDLQTVYAPSDRAALGAYVLFQPSRTPQNQDYNNTTFGGGGRMALDTGMFRLAAEAGYISRQFGNPLLTDLQGLTYDVKLDWFPTPLLTLSGQGTRNVQNSGSPKVGGITVRIWRVEARYELLRNLVITAEQVWQQDRFPGIGQSAASTTQKLRGEYSFNRFVAIGAYGLNGCLRSSVTATERHVCGFVGGVSLTFRQ